ncbi:ankyrin [Azoarcus sp. CIB]|nr:ankyrin [Azoarcus sp. CIB]
MCRWSTRSSKVTARLPSREHASPCTEPRVNKGHTSVVRHLLIGGAKRNQLDADGHDELRLAQTLGRHDVVTILEGQRFKRDV